MLLVVISSIENLCYRDFLIDLYKEYKEDMFRYACSILREERLAEDAVNQAFLGIIKNVEKIYDLDVSKIKSYVVISVRNACYNINQKRSRQWEKEVMCDYIENRLNENWDVYVQNLENSCHWYKRIMEDYPDVPIICGEGVAYCGSKIVLWE